ncbi:hypothetical protein LIA77_05451 [Sarocladium implicatum]|nr:hypothetical protein LIA77_05451 [Sarocladium implicatum]
MKTYHSIEHVLAGDVALAIAARQAKWGESRYKTWAAITEVTRSFQFHYINSLSNADLYYLMALLLLARQGWSQWASMRDWDHRADIVGYHEMVFVETLMRHGSGFLYSVIRGFGTRSTHWSGVEELVSEDLRGLSGMPRRSLWAALWATAHVRGWQLPQKEITNMG